MLSPTGILIFRKLEKPATISELAEGLGLSESRISESVTSLVGEGFLIKERHGKKVFVSRETALHAVAFAGILREFPRLPLEKLFSYSAMEVLGVLQYPHSSSEITLMTGLDRRTISTALLKLGTYGLVLKKEKMLLLNRRHRNLENFVRYYWEYKTNQKLEIIYMGGGLLLWQRGAEFLFKVPGEVKDMEIREFLKNRLVHKTGVSQLSEYGLGVISDSEYYFYSRRKLKIEDVFIHTILTDPENPIYNSYALALFQKCDRRSLLKAGKIYDMDNHIEKLLEYLDTKEKNVSFLLPWGEFQALLERLNV